MFDLFGSIKHLAKVSTLCIDNGIFKLHYKATFMMLVAFSLVATSKQYIGDPIDCIVDEAIPQPIMDTYCWIYSTFTIPNKLTGTVGKDVAHPGVAPHVMEDEVKYHKYYQWVCFVLMFQAVLFYVPRYLWKSFEGNRIKTLSFDMKQPIVEQKVKDARKRAFIKYFTYNIKSHNIYFWQFFACEILNFVNVVGQIFFMNFFLDGDFLTYGHRVFQFTHSYVDPNNEDPMARVFPKVTKCTFHKYGPSGGVQKFDGLCVLPVNILNEKIYAILWFWFVILSILSGLVLIYRILTILCGYVRHITLPFGHQVEYKNELKFVVNKGQIGDWFLLVQLKKNMDGLIFKEFITALAEDDDFKKMPDMKACC